MGEILDGNGVASKGQAMLLIANKTHYFVNTRTKCARFVAPILPVLVLCYLREQNLNPLSQARPQCGT